MIGTVALLLRFVNLTDIPPGLHGDEAAIGLEARRILDTGWIGVYSGIAGGNPTGVFYLAAIVFSFVSDPILAVRGLSALGGVVAVVGLYVLMRRNLGFGSAVVGSFLLAFAGWHIQFSRIGFVTGMWLPFVVLGAIALMEAIRSKVWYWWAAAGALLSSSFYIYQGHAPFTLILGLFIGWYFFGWMAIASATTIALVYVAPSPLTLALLGAGIVLLLFNRSLRDRARLVNAASFGVASLVVMGGMLNFMRTNTHDYFERGGRLSVIRTDEWQAQSELVDKAGFLLDRYWLWWDRLTFNPIPNGADPSGSTPLVPATMLAICLVGAVIALIRRPNALVVFSAVVVILAPLLAVMTDLALRRSLVIIPFLALLGGAGVIALVRTGLARSRGLGIGVAITLLVLIGKSSFDNYTDFFDTTVNSAAVQHTFGTDLRETAFFLDSLPDDSYVYFFCERWALDYDSAKLIAPDVEGVNRLPKWGGSGGYEIDRSQGAPVFVLMGNEMDRLPEIQRLYPGGQVVEGAYMEPPLDGPAFVAYILS